ncbi:MAG TPA: translation initiation factor IF-2 [Chloroflexota bacterium]|nr:translation initiation factor IF-2 [Chloroflexota bacterium]
MGRRTRSGGSRRPRGGHRPNSNRGGNGNRGTAVLTPTPEPQGPRIIEVPTAITVKDLADRMSLTPVDIIKVLMKNGVMATINQELDFDTATIVATDLGWEVKEAPTIIEEIEQQQEETEPEDESQLESRPPVVTVMGHVDHGKTALLDAIRSTNVVAQESGGITQHIGAYQAVKNDQRITFLDTPGHAAFTQMRARGAQVTDVAIIVVAADDGVMPQTREAISHARAANVPIIVALNKMDKPEANPDRVKAELNEAGLNLVEWGGDIELVPVSAREQTGIDDLLTTILLTSEIGNYRANPNRPAVGTVIEAKLDRARGPLATVIVQNGTLHVGDVIVAGSAYGKVRALFDERGKHLKTVGPGSPAAILGLNEVPEAGDRVQVLPDEKLARAVALERGAQKRAENLTRGRAPVADILNQIAQGETKELNLILKADVQGSLEAITHALQDLNTDTEKINILLTATGAISESDVSLAQASNALIIGFNTRPDAAARRAAEVDHVDIRYYDIIYNLIEDIEQALSGMREPVYQEVIEGHAEVRATFKAGRTVIAGCYVTDGSIKRNAEARVLRDGQVVTNGRISSLKRFKEDAREVTSGYECGIVIDGFNDVQEGDIIEAFGQERVA